MSFGPILYGAKKLSLKIETRYEISNNASQDICKIANEENFNFLLVGSGISMSNHPDDIAASRYRDSFYNRVIRRIKAPESWFYPAALLQDKTKQFIEQSNCPVGVFINRSFVKATDVIVIVGTKEDLFLLDYAHDLVKTTYGSVDIVNTADHATMDYLRINEGIKAFVPTVRRGSYLRDEKDLTPQLFIGYNFMLISYNTWNVVSEQRREALQKMPSTLILSK